MTKSTVYCDECDSPKGDANHWHRIGVQFSNPELTEVVSVELGCLSPPTDENDKRAYRQHDLCGESCLHKHIDKLLASSTARG